MLLKGESAMTSTQVKTIFYAVALALGIAVIVTNIVSPLAVGTVTSLLAAAVALVVIGTMRK
jgi:hypothetical protein